MRGAVRPPHLHWQPSRHVQAGSTARLPACQAAGRAHPRALPMVTLEEVCYAGCQQAWSRKGAEGLGELLFHVQ